MIIKKIRLEDYYCIRKIHVGFGMNYFNFFNLENNENVIF